MMEQPTLETPRLILRPFTLDDAPDVHRLLQDPEITANTLLIPYPYEEGMAETWISMHGPSYEHGTSATFAIVIRESNALAGAIGLTIRPDHARAELGYWIGKPFWNGGYCTEAARRIVAYGFEALDLNRIHCSHFTRNPASGRVMQKIGMLHEGCHRQHVFKSGVPEDLEVHGILKEDYLAASETSQTVASKR